MTKIEMFRSMLEYVPAEAGDLREEIEQEIAKLSKAKAPKPETVACAEQIKTALENMGEVSKKELQEMTGCTHQRVAAAANMLEKEGFLTVHPKGDGKDCVWYSRN